MDSKREPTHRVPTPEASAGATAGEKGRGQVEEREGTRWVIEQIQQSFR